MAKVIDGSFDDGVLHGMAIAAALLARDYDNPTLALEVLGAAGCDRVADIDRLHLDDYDADPLLKIVKQ